MLGLHQDFQQSIRVALQPDTRTHEQDGTVCTGDHRLGLDMPGQCAPDTFPEFMDGTAIDAHKEAIGLVNSTDSRSLSSAKKGLAALYREAGKPELAAEVEATKHFTLAPGCEVAELGGRPEVFR